MIQPPPGRDLKLCSKGEDPTFNLLTCKVSVYHGVEVEKQSTGYKLRLDGPDTQQLKHGNGITSATRQ